MSETASAASGGRNTVTMALDDHMVFAFCVLTHSLSKTAQSPFELVVGFFPEKLSPINQDLIRSFLSSLSIHHDLRELQPHPLFTERRHLTMTTFSKFVLSDQIDRAHLWLDIDTIVRPGWDQIFQDIAAAPRDAQLVVAKMLPGPHTRFSGFNAGVLGWTTTPRALWEPELADMPEKRFSSEQFLFNTLYGDTSHQIDTAYNFLSSWFRNDEELDSAKIIHFSGPIKPWHLPRRHRTSWLQVNRSWEYWFSAEDALQHSLDSSPLDSRIKRAARNALFSGRLHTGKGALAGWVLRALSIVGPLGSPIVSVIARRSQR